MAVLEFTTVEIANINPEDLSKVFELYDHAIAYQRKHGYNVWPHFREQMVQEEIRMNRHWKITEGAAMACVFSVAYNDPLLWGEKDKNNAIYLHRIATHPDYKGRQMINRIINWSLIHAGKAGRKFIRMDTWGDNDQLSNYYVKAGFHPVGKQYIIKNESLPEHYWGIYLNLFEMNAVDSNDETASH